MENDIFETVLGWTVFKVKLIYFQILAITSGIHTCICLRIMKLKFIWPAILTSKYISIIFSPV